MFIGVITRILRDKGLPEVGENFTIRTELFTCGNFSLSVGHKVLFSLVVLFGVYTLRGSIFGYGPICFSNSVYLGKSLSFWTVWAFLYGIYIGTRFLTFTWSIDGIFSSLLTATSLTAFGLTLLGDYFLLAFLTEIEKRSFNLVLILD